MVSIASTPSWCAIDGRGERGLVSTSAVNRYVALLRGINVSGHNLVAMTDLRALMAPLAVDDVATYLQSGNVVFRSEATDPDDLARAIAARIHAELDLEVAVLVRTAHDLDRVATTNPFLTNDGDGPGCYVTFLAAPPDPDRVAALSTAKDASSADSFLVGSREVFLSCPNGYGRTKLNNTFFEKKLAVAATTRNWRTVTTLAEMARS
jgi:uncharacterized protein (DUF1697 family)